MIHPKSQRTPCTRLMLRVGGKKSNTVKKEVLEERKYDLKKRATIIDLCRTVFSLVS